MRNKASQILFNYWNTVRDGRIAPKRLEIDPSALSQILSQTMILEVVDGNNFPFRIAGTSICEFLGGEMRGCNFFELWGAVDRRHFRSAFDAALSSGAPVIASTTSHGPLSTSYTSEIVLLPLYDHKDRLSRLLGCWSQDPSSLASGQFQRRVDYHQLTTITNQWPDKSHDQPEAISRLAQRDFPAVEPPATLYSDMDIRIVRRERRQFRVLDGGLSD